MFEPSPKLVKWARRLAPHADQSWVVWFFFGLFFLDVFVMVIPIDGLMVITLVFVPQKTKAWFISGLCGAAMGYVLLGFLTHTSFLFYILKWIENLGYLSSYEHGVATLAEQGYLYLTLLTFTVVPQTLCLMGSLLVGLKPVPVLLLLIFSKLFKFVWMFYAAHRFKDMILGIHEIWKEKNLKR